MSVLGALRAAGVPAGVAAAEAPLAEAAMREAAVTTQPRARHFLAQVLHESAGLRYFEEIASGAAYEGRADLGNTRRGDGRRFKGRGPIQLTGRANYGAAGAALGLALEQHPDLAARHDVGWRIAGWYWRSRGLNDLADRGELEGITRRINGGLNGLDSRRRYFAAIGGQDCRPSSDALAHLTPVERRRSKELLSLRRSRRDLPRRQVLVRVLTQQRKAIWHAAQSSAHGWERLNRRERYRTLLKLTTP